MRFYNADALLDSLQHHIDCTYMSVCSSVDECKARRDEIQYAIELVKAQPPVEVKLRTDEDILGVDEAIETINRLRKAYRKTKLVVRCRGCEKYNAPVVRGEWSQRSCFDENENVYVCSVCDEPWTLIAGTPLENNMRHCPNCGAKMEDKT